MQRPPARVARWAGLKPHDPHATAQQCCGSRYQVAHLGKFRGVRVVVGVHLGLCFRQGGVGSQPRDLDLVRSGMTRANVSLPLFEGKRPVSRRFKREEPEPRPEHADDLTRDAVRANGLPRMSIALK